jgi:hypothetical protein
VLGHVALVEGLIARIRAELGSPAIVVATGELAPLVAAETSIVDRIEPWLALIGLRLFYELNRRAPTPGPSLTDGGREPTSQTPPRLRAGEGAGG